MELIMQVGSVVTPLLFQIGVPENVSKLLEL